MADRLKVGNKKLFSAVANGKNVSAIFRGDKLVWPNDIHADYILDNSGKFTAPIWARYADIFIRGGGGGGGSGRGDNGRCGAGGKAGTHNVREGIPLIPGKVNQVSVQIGMGGAAGTSSRDGGAGGGTFVDVSTDGVIKESFSCAGGAGGGAGAMAPYTRSHGEDSPARTWLNVTHPGATGGKAIEGTGGDGGSPSAGGAGGNGGLFNRLWNGGRGGNGYAWIRFRSD